MTDSQKRVYDYIVKYNDKHGEVPSTRVAGDHFGISQQAIHGHYIVERRVFKDGEWEMVGDRWKYRHFHSAERAGLLFVK